MWLAERDGKVVGRAAAVLNKAYNKKMDVKQMRFTRFDFVDDAEVVDALFEKVVEYAKEMGLNEIIGPIGFSDLDKQGLVVEGFEEEDMYVTPYNYPYYVKHFERLGLTKKVDWLEFQITIPDKMVDRLDRISEMAIQRYGYKVLRFKKISDIKPYIIPALQILNEAFEKLFGTVWLSDKQLLDFSKLIMLVGNPDYVSVVQNKEGEIIGYGFMAPSISKAVRRSKGKLLPCGIFRILRELKKNKTLDLYSIGVKPEYQNKGVNAIILRESLRGAIKNGMKLAETGPELETNVEVQSQWKMFEHRNHKRRRCYTYYLR
jgi:N-acetylglutamate synthase-like GNAT family acetyltransferase